jgi:hypothetical protein
MGNAEVTRKEAWCRALAERLTKNTLESARLHGHGVEFQSKNGRASFFSGQRQLVIQRHQRIATHIP